MNVNAYKTRDNVKLFSKENQEKQSQTKPIYSFCVLRAAYCEKEFEKTKPISDVPKSAQSLI